MQTSSFRESHGTELRKLLLFYGSGVGGALMTPSKIWIFPAAAAALTIGHVGYDPKLTGEGFPFPPTYTVLAANNQQNQVQSEKNADE